MSLKTIRVFAVIAFALFAAAFLLTGLGTLLQAPIKQLWNAPPEAVAHRVVPVQALIDGLAMLGLSLWHMLSALRCRSRRSSRVQVIVLTILLLVWRVLINPLITQVNNSFQASLGADSLTSHVILTSALNIFLSPLSAVAYVLMLLSMGGFFGRAGELRGNPQGARPAVSAETAPEAEPAHEPEPMPPTDRDKPTEQNEEKEGTLL